MKILSLDTEDDSRGNPLLIDFYDGTNHYTFTNPMKAWEWLVKQSPAHVWACNTEYDLLNLFGDWTARVLTLQYVSSGLMRATMDEANITFYDTMRHSNPPLSVAAMGKLVGKEKKKDYFGDRVTPALIAACQTDSEIVFDYVTLQLNEYQKLGLSLKATLPAMAMQYWHDHFNRVEYPRMKTDIRERFRQGYYGGRVEVFRFGKIKETVNHYDVNSLYPHVMKSFQYPDIARRERQTRKPDFSKFGMAMIDIDVPETNIPCLPYRSEKEILFPFGKMTGAYCYPEIRQAIADGAKVGKIHWSIEYDQGIDPFSKYIDTCYRNRMNAKNGVENRFWKMMMNSLYGKFGSRDSLLTISKDREFTITSPARFSNVIWAAYVTCYARLVLLQHLRKCSAVYYTDTDSVFTPDTLKTSSDLGELKLEGVYKFCEFYGNKVYVVDDVYRARGVPRKREGSEEDPARDFILTGRCIFRRPARLRESRRSFARANVWYDAEKQFKAEYTKRKILKNGKTLPFTLSEYEF